MHDDHKYCLLNHSSLDSQCPHKNSTWKKKQNVQVAKHRRTASITSLSPSPGFYTSIHAKHHGLIREGGGGPPSTWRSASNSSNSWSKSSWREAIFGWLTPRFDLFYSLWDPSSQSLMGQTREGGRGSPHPSWPTILCEKWLFSL